MSNAAEEQGGAVFNLSSPVSSSFEAMATPESASQTAGTGSTPNITEPAQAISSPLAAEQHVSSESNRLLAFHTSITSTMNRKRYAPGSTSATKASDVEISPADSSEPGVPATEHVSESTHMTITLCNSHNSVAITGCTNMDDVIVELQRLAGASSPWDSRGIINRELVPVSPKNPPACLSGLPLELLRMIFKLTLMNPILGTRESVGGNDSYGLRASYGLSPNLLLVNKHINRAGTEFLYGQDVFYMACLSSDSPHSWNIYTQVNISPITRYALTYESQFPFMRDMKGFRKVQHWNVVVSLDNRDFYDYTTSWSFSEFCRALFHSEVESIQVKLIPRGVVQYSEHYLDTAAALNPLRLLRNVKEFCITDALLSEVPNILSQNAPLPDIVSQMKDQSNLEAELVTLVKGNEPVELCFEMYGRLLKYAQTFERFARFKDDMAVRQEQISETKVWRSHYGCYHNYYLLNPFKIDYAHPVEAALVRARTASDIDDAKTFKEERRYILEYFEPQFRRLATADLQIVEFIKEEKRCGNLFESIRSPCGFSHTYHRSMAIAIILIESFASAMNRDMPLETLTEIRLVQSLYDQLYADSDGSRALADMRATLETHDIERFLKLYRVALQEIESFWLGICEARKRLFELDTLDERDCDIDPEIHRCTERIDWTVDESEISPENGYHANAEDYELPDSDDDDDDGSDSDSDSDGDSNGDSYSAGTQDDANAEDANEDSDDIGGSHDEDDGITGQDPDPEGVDQVSAGEDNSMGMLSLEGEENMGGAVGTDEGAHGWI